MRALLIGYFSTVGDLEVLHHVERLLTKMSVKYDVGSFSTRLSRLIPGGVNIYTLDPRDYTHLCVICGPFDKRFLARRGVDLDRFSHCTRIGINLTMLEDLETYNPLDALIGRDSNRWTQPDVSFLEDVKKVPVAGLCLAGTQQEYGNRQKHNPANDLLRGLADRAGLAVLNLDTQWPAAHNVGGLESSEQFESICARVDVMLTTRLHGMALALKNGVPVIALDAISGGGKVSSQAKAIGWPELFVIDAVDNSALDAALARCLQPSGRARALACAATAREALAKFPDELIQALNTKPRGLPTQTAPDSYWRGLQNAVSRMLRHLSRNSAGRAV